MESVFHVTKDEIINKQTGSKIIFKGIKTSSGTQTASLKSLAGVTTWVLDEAEELTDEDVFDKIDFSIRQKDKINRVILILNPTTKEHFIYRKFFEDRGWNEGDNGSKGDTTYIHSTYLDNLNNLSASFVKQVETMKDRRPEKYRHQILGGWLDKAEGVIFTNWKLGEVKHVGKSVFGQDFGFSVDPTTLIETNIDKANKIIYLRLHYYKPNLSTTDIATLNAQFAGENLQIVTQRYNSHKTQGKYSSKYKGVTWHSPRSKWRAAIYTDGKLRHLGYFESEIDASNKYQEALSLCV